MNIFGSKRGKETGGWKVLPKEMLPRLLILLR